MHRHITDIDALGYAGGLSHLERVFDEFGIEFSQSLGIVIPRVNKIIMLAVTGAIKLGTAHIGLERAIAAEVDVDTICHWEAIWVLN